MVNSTDESPARFCVSGDGEFLGVIVGIHRDPETDAAKWAVLEPEGSPPGRHLFVPVQQAVPQRDGLHLAYPASRVRSAPAVREHTDLTTAEEVALMRHYGLLPPEPPGASGDSSETEAAMVRSEERLSVTGVEWRPYRRAHVRRVVRTEEVTEVITLRREELVIEEEPITAVERLEVAFGLVTQPEAQEIAMTLHREEFVIQKRVVPYERVRVSAARVTAPWSIQTTLRREQIDIERGGEP